MKRIVILGSTGSIGTQTLDIVRACPNEFEVIGLCAGTNKALFEKQVFEFKPKYKLLAFESENYGVELEKMAGLPEADIVVNAVSGCAGFFVSHAACRAGKILALANKESIVMAGELLMNLAAKTGAKIFPIDSELSAIWQIIDGKDKNSIEKVILTASGGPFFGWPREKLKNITPAKAASHPTWKMGKKISIDSATLMNKAFEIIETRWMFDITPEKIQAVIHRQSIAHALVQFSDGNTAAILSVPDMRIPISYALFYPKRRASSPSSVDFSKLNLSFEAPDYSIFPGLLLAYEVLREGGIMPAVFCMADEIAVNKFFAGEISFLGIYDFIKSALARVKNMPLSFESTAELSQICNFEL